MAHSSFGRGWPACTAQRRTIVRGDGLRVSVHVELAELVALLMDETERRGYDIRPGETWGGACRAIRGSSSPSNHSWWTAVDINSLTNPMGSRLVTDMPRWMVDLWAKYGFRWGGTYTTRPDAMHFEFMGTVADARRLTAQARDEFAGNQGGPVEPARNPLEEDDMPYILAGSAIGNHYVDASGATPIYTQAYIDTLRAQKVPVVEISAASPEEQRLTLSARSAMTDDEILRFAQATELRVARLQHLEEQREPEGG